MSVEVCRDLPNRILDSIRVRGNQRKDFDMWPLYLGASGVESVVPCTFLRREANDGGCGGLVGAALLLLLRFILFGSFSSSITFLHFRLSLF
jgi:hypothetical protein